ncbi:uncharacterized protein [Panulirus ornatus]|uniref:uncharacterized protein n=1 Tax=Panulirus ornatus TaxID=150431 RepID=UPI003A859A8C
MTQKQVNGQRPIHGLNRQRPSPNYFTACMGRLRATEKTLPKGGVAYAKEYSDQISDMVERGVARKLTTDEIKDYQGPVHYIPHHEILRPDSKSTPIRIVFNSSASYMGHVLNDYYAKGPDMLCDLFGILLRFRQSPVAIVGDISKMYNSVLLSEEDKMIHQFLWRDMNNTREPDHYCLQTVTFGDRPIGVIAITAFHKTAEMFKDKYPETADMIINNSYVDDILHSCESAEETLERMKTTEEFLKRGGFQTKQWVMSGSHDMTEVPKIIATEVGKVLGMIWEPKKDQFSYKPDNALGNPTLVIYADASNIAYSTCACIRFELKDGTFSAQLHEAKSQIAPIQQITTPRLELSAAVLSARLRKVTEKETSFVFDRFYPFTQLDTYITDIEKTKIQAHAIIAKVTKKDKASVNEMHKLRMQRLTPPHFDGKIRDFPTFCKDYERLNEISI